MSRAPHHLSSAIVEVCGMFFRAAVICAVHVYGLEIELWERWEKFYANRKD